MNKYDNKMTNRKNKEKNLMRRIKGCKETVSRKEMIIMIIIITIIVIVVNIYTGYSLSALQALLSERAMFKMESKEILKKSKLIHKQCKSRNCTSIIIIKKPNSIN